MNSQVIQSKTKCNHKYKLIINNLLNAIKMNKLKFKILMLFALPLLGFLTNCEQDQRDPSRVHHVQKVSLNASSTHAGDAFEEGTRVKLTIYEGESGTTTIAKSYSEGGTEGQEISNAEFTFDENRTIDLYLEDGKKYHITQFDVLEGDTGDEIEYQLAQEDIPIDLSSPDADLSIKVLLQEYTAKVEPGPEEGPAKKHISFNSEYVTDNKYSFQILFKIKDDSETEVPLAIDKDTKNNYDFKVKLKVNDGKEVLHLGEDYNIFNVVEDTDSKTYQSIKITLPNTYEHYINEASDKFFLEVTDVNKKVEDKTYYDVSNELKGGTDNKVTVHLEKAKKEDNAKAEPCGNLKGSKPLVTDNKYSFQISFKIKNDSGTEEELLIDKNTKNDYHFNVKLHLYDDEGHKMDLEGTKYKEEEILKLGGEDYNIFDVVKDTDNETYPSIKITLPNPYEHYIKDNRKFYLEVDAGKKVEDRGYHDVSSALKGGTEDKVTVTLRKRKRKRTTSKGIVINPIYNFYAPLNREHMDVWEKQISPDDIDGWTKFDFSTGEKVDENSPDWDVAFSGHFIIVNGGEKTEGFKKEPERTGKAAGAILTDTTFEEVTDVSKVEWKQDNATKHAIDEDIMSNRKGMFWYDFPVHLVYTIKDRVLVFRTRDEKYVKMQVWSYYKYYAEQENIPVRSFDFGYHTFQYAYNPSGDTNLNTSE